MVSETDGPIEFEVSIGKYYITTLTTILLRLVYVPLLQVSKQVIYLKFASLSPKVNVSSEGDGRDKFLNF